MMGLLASVLGVFSGPLVRALVLAFGGVFAITGVHLVIENWKDNLRAEGKRVCDANWERRIREEASAAANADARAARALLDSERKTVGELNDRLVALQLEIDGERAGASDDERCLSDRVLERLSPEQAPGQHPGNPARPAKKPAAPGPSSNLQEVLPPSTVNPSKG
jgi:hypothetical protein